MSTFKMKDFLHWHITNLTRVVFVLLLKRRTFYCRLPASGPSYQFVFMIIIIVIRHHLYVGWFRLYFFPHGATAHNGPGPLHDRGFTITLGHTIFGGTPLEGWSARRRDLYPSPQNIRERDPCPRRDSNLQFQKAIGPRPTPLGSAFTIKYMKQTMSVGYIFMEIFCIYNLCYM